ncbi:hypothetical protein PSCLAVI8L_150078 [Pseudoclavibacter sp. 8L]|nr:hypothetical protein PSCLAVI8L_150078 [Pseudoclavibacter sp. 8L]
MVDARRWGRGVDGNEAGPDRTRHAGPFLVVQSLLTDWHDELS